MDDPLVTLRLVCPGCIIKLWFDEDDEVWFCQGCSYTVENVSTDDIL
jgi:ribosomal protein L37AE/L43A